MTEREKQLLKIAIEIIELNSEINPRLTGSLLLAIKGINKRREAVDIDFVCYGLCEEEDFYPKMPDAFIETDMDGKSSQVDAIRFENKDCLKVEFMQSYESHDDSDDVLIDGDYTIPCGNLTHLIAKKMRYSRNDLNAETKKKHTEDVDYLFANNTDLPITRI